MRGIGRIYIEEEEQSDEEFGFVITVVSASNAVKRYSEYVASWNALIIASSVIYTRIAPSIKQSSHALRKDTAADAGLPADRRTTRLADRIWTSACCHSSLPSNSTCFSCR